MMSNPLFDRKPITDTIAWKVSRNIKLRKAGIPVVTKGLKEKIEENSRLPTRRHYPALDDMNLESRAKELIEIFKDVDF